MKILKFRLHNKSHEYEVIKPVPANWKIPEWFRQGEVYLQKSSESVLPKELRHAGMKACMPLLDSLTSGYLLLLWRNVEITKNENNVVKWRYVVKDKDGQWVEDTSENPYIAIEERPFELGYTMPRPAGYAFNHLTWHSFWGMEAPRGWSILFTHPLNQFQLPFITGSGIVDSDNFTTNGRVPFFIKDGWTGVLEEGTPLVQFIPIKRATWISKYSDHFNKKDHWGITEISKTSNGHYRNKLWISKKYISSIDKRKKDEDNN
jgi:hypothetical protein